MQILLLLTLLSSAVASQACLNLTGKLAGNCLYKSPSFGDLNGSIEFNIQQPTCNQITIDGSALAIPGSYENKAAVGSTVDHIKLVMSWQDSNQDILDFKYIRTIDENGVRTDDINLNGFFKKNGNKYILEQKGVVDSDPVEIYCELYK